MSYFTARYGVVYLTHQHKHRLLKVAGIVLNGIYSVEGGVTRATQHDII